MCFVNCANHVLSDVRHNLTICQENRWTRRRARWWTMDVLHRNSHSIFLTAVGGSRARQWCRLLILHGSRPLLWGVVKNVIHERIVYFFRSKHVLQSWWDSLRPRVPCLLQHVTEYFYHLSSRFSELWLKVFPCNPGSISKRCWCQEDNGMAIFI